MRFQACCGPLGQDLPGVAVIADDILVYGSGSTEEEYRQDHDANLKRLLQRGREANLELNKHKLRLWYTVSPPKGYVLILLR